MNSITRAALSVGLVSLLSGCIAVSPQEAADDSDTSRPVGKVIVEIGQEDKSDLEFRRSGLTGITEYRCQVGVLRKGRHRIELTVADDGKGNAVYQWDALALIAVNR